MNFRCGVCATCGLGQHLGIDCGQVICRHAGDASVGVVGQAQRCRRDAISVAVSLYLLNGRIGCGDQSLNFRCGVCATCDLGQHLGVYSSQVICRHAGNASCHVVCYGQGRRYGVVAVVVVGLYLGQGGVRCSHQKLYFGRSVCATCGLGQHLRVYSSHVLCRHASDARVGVVNWGECGRYGDVAVVVGLYFAQRYGLLLSADQFDNLAGQVGRRLGVGCSGTCDYVGFGDFIERGRGGAVAGVAGVADGEVLNQQVDAGTHTAGLDVHA